MYQNKKILLNMLMVLIALVVVFGAIELVLRVVGYNTLHKFKDGRELILRNSVDPDVIYELTPGSSGHAWGTDVRINSLGIRGGERVLGGDDVYRVLTLGDSITFGNFLPEEATYASQLEQKLNRDDRVSEVLNFGVGGYDIAQYTAQLRHKGVGLEPDLVVVGMCLNDVGISSPNLQYIFKIRKWQENPLFKSRTLQLLANMYEKIKLKGWMENQNKPEVFRENYADRITEIGDSETELLGLMEGLGDVYPADWYKSPDRIGRMRYAMGELSRLARENGFSVVVVIIPWLELDDEGKYPFGDVHRIIEMEAERAGIETIDPADEFVKVGMLSLRITENPDDHVHPNRRGHEIIAESIARYISEKEN